MITPITSLRSTTAFNIGVGSPALGALAMPILIDDIMGNYTLLVIKFLVLLHFVVKRFAVNVQQLGRLAFVEVYFLQGF